MTNLYKKMKYIKFLMTVSAFLVGAATLLAKQDQIPIPIDCLDEDTPIIRVPSSIRIECFFDSESEELIFGLNNTTGTTSVSIVNSLTGETQNEVFVGNGLFYVPFSGTYGLWHISITLSNGSEYVGEIYL